MLFGMFLGFILMTAAGVALLWLIWRRMAEHLKENPSAVEALATHLFVPLMGKKDRPEEEKPKDNTT